jgi:hypothetical protein
MNYNFICSRVFGNAQGSRVIIVVVQVGAVKIYVAAVEALRKKDRGGQNRMKLLVYQKKNWCFSEFHLAPPPPPPFEC